MIIIILILIIMMYVMCDFMIVFFFNLCEVQVLFVSCTLFTTATMALGFTQTIPYAYAQVIVSCITSIIIVFVFIIHIRGYFKFGQQNSSKNKNSVRKKYINSYSIVNIVTIMTILLYAINSSVIFLSKFDLIINIIPCKIYNDICAANWQIANFSKLIVFTLRLDMAFKGSKYQYNRKNLFILIFIIFIQSIVNVILHIQFQYGSKYSVFNNTFYACHYEVPIYIPAVGNLTDLIASSIMVYLFIKPLQSLYIKEKEFQAMNLERMSTVTSINSDKEIEETARTVTNSDDDDDTKTTNPGMMRSISVSSVKSNDNGDDNNADIMLQRKISRKKLKKLMQESKTAQSLKKIAFKYTVLTFTATLSTLIILTSISVIGSGTFVVLDYMINTFCLVLMSKWYENGQWFNKLCCGVIKCVLCCHFIYKNSKKMNGNDIETDMAENMANLKNVKSETEGGAGISLNEDIDDHNEQNRVTEIKSMVSNQTIYSSDIEDDEDKNMDNNDYDERPIRMEMDLGLDESDKKDQHGMIMIDVEYDDDDKNWEENNNQEQEKINKNEINVQYATDMSKKMHDDIETDGKQMEYMKPIQVLHFANVESTKL